MNINLFRTLSWLLVSLITSTAYATNGYFSDGTGAKNRGMGGAGTALAQEAGSVVLNPSAAVNMGERMDIGVGLFNPSPRGWSISGNNCTSLPMPCGADLDNSADSTMDYFLIPFYGQTFRIDDHSSWAITLTALGGINTDYEVHPFQNFSPTPLGSLRADLKQIQLGGTYARKVADGVSLGATVAFVYQQFQAAGLGVFGNFGLSTDPANLSNNGKSTSTGIGLTFGATFEVSKDVTVGLVYSPEIDMSEFDEYRGLFAEDGDFDIPSNYALGVAWQMSSDLLFSLDYRVINYTDVPSVSSDSAVLTSTCLMAPTNMGPAANTDPTCLGGAQGAGFGWDDITVIKFGVAWTQGEHVYRAGWNHGDSPIEGGNTEATLNIIAPAVTEDHLTLGMTMSLDSSSELSFDFIHSFDNSVTGDVPAAFGGGETTLSMEQNFFEVQYGKRF